MSKLSFSQRLGIEEPKSIIQIENIDDDLATQLWNTYHIFFVNTLNAYMSTSNEDLKSLYKRIWIRFFKKRIDEIPNKTDFIYYIKQVFFNEHWYTAYNFIEFVSQNSNQSVSRIYQESCNRVLEEELSGYRFINGVIVPVSSEVEVQCIQESIKLSSPYHNVSEHIKTSIQLLSNKTNPDYRNSIKESISAVETVCKIIVGDDSAVLGKALKKIERDHNEMNSLFKSSIEKLYAYTNDGNGIRHSLMDNEDITQDEAIFMLISCSAFCNYMIKKI